jgi:hypothetical protein
MKLSKRASEQDENPAFKDIAPIVFLKKIKEMANFYDVGIPVIVEIWMFRPNEFEQKYYRMKEYQHETASRWK